MSWKAHRHRHGRAQALPFPGCDRRGVVWHGHRHERAQAFGLGLGLGFGEAAGVEAPAFTGLSDDTAGKLRAAAAELLRVTEPNVGDGGEAAEGAEDWNSCAAGKCWPLLPVLLRPQDVATQAGTCFAPFNLDLCGPAPGRGPSEGLQAPRGRRP